MWFFDGCVTMGLDYLGKKDTRAINQRPRTTAKSDEM